MRMESQQCKNYYSLKHKYVLGTVTGRATFVQSHEYGILLKGLGLRKVSSSEYRPVSIITERNLNIIVIYGYLS